MSRKCTHTDCATCPYPDCISASGPSTGEKKKPGPKPMDPAVKKQRQREQSHRYYMAHRKEHAQKMKKYQEEHREELRQYYKEYTKKRLGYSHTNKHMTLVWVTDGVNTTRVKPELVEEYIEKGYRIGRTLKPYKYKTIYKEEDNGSKDTSN